MIFLCLLTDTLCFRIVPCCCVYKWKRNRNWLPQITCKGSNPALLKRISCFNPCLKVLSINAVTCVIWFQPYESFVKHLDLITVLVFIVTQCSLSVEKNVTLEPPQILPLGWINNLNDAIATMPHGFIDYTKSKRESWISAYYLVAILNYIKNIYNLYVYIYIYKLNIFLKFIMFIFHAT